MFNSGQTCIAPDYVMVPEGRAKEFAEAAQAAYARMYPTMKDNTDHTAIISDRHFARLQHLVQEAEENGVTVARSGSEAPDPETRKMPLTMLVEPGEDVAAMQEEIFGPVLPVVTYSDLSSAIRAINARPRPLALYYFDRKSSRVDEVLARTTSGGVSINEVLAHISVEDLPFGGVGPSGMGAYHGEAGFLTFTHQKSVLQQARFNLVSLLNPPYGGIARWFAKVMTTL
jgi:acyl-CoA reductase-like NAD-dependent aldehyde dehydrogenase